MITKRTSRDYAEALGADLGRSATPRSPNVPVTARPRSSHGPRQRLLPGHSPTGSDGQLAGRRHIRHGEARDRLPALEIRARVALVIQ